MSEQPPPSFGGPPHYAQQWPPAYPAMMPPNFAIPQDYSATNSHQNHSAPFDYNMANVDANSRIPASSEGLNPAAFFPPQFPFFNQFDPSQFPPNFSPMHFAPMGHQPIPMPTASASATPLPQQTPQHSNPTFVKPTKSKGILIRAPPGREEGEVSEPVHEKPLKASRKPSRQYSDMEEGETMSSSGRSSRSSGSRTSLASESAYLKKKLICRSLQPPSLCFGRSYHRPTRDGRTNEANEISSAATYPSSGCFAQLGPP